MVALFVVLTIITFLTIDYLVQRSQLSRARATAAASASTALAAMAREIEARKELPMFAHVPIDRIPKDAFLDIGHTWVKVEPEGLVRVGADWLPGTLLGQPDKVDLTAAGSIVKRGDPILRLRRHGRSVTLRAPVDGTIEEVNVSLLDEPAAVAGDPFGSGWLYRLTPANLGSALRGMLIDDEAVNWMHREIQRLRDALNAISRRAALSGETGLATRLALATQPALAATGPTMQDGGLPVAGLAEQLDPEQWNELARTFFES